MSQATQTTTRKSNNPAEHIIFGGILIILGFLAFMMQIQTNEASLLGQQVVNVFSPNWSILIQPIQLAFGALFGNALDASHAQVDFVGWLVECIFMGCTISYPSFKSSFDSTHQLIAKAAFVVMIGIIIYNGYNDFTYGSFVTVGFLGHFLFALLMSFAVGFAMPAGFKMMRNGWKAA